MDEDDRVALLRDLDEHAAHVKELAAAARANPEDPERVLAVCDAVFTMREVLDELGVWYARSGNDEWDGITAWQTVRQLGLGADASSGLGAIPFPLFGLPDGMLAPRTLGATGSSGDVVELVALEHGDRDGDAWVQVAVTGPRRTGTSVRDPLPMIAGEYLGLLGTELSTIDAVTGAVDAVLAAGFAEAEIDVDGEAKTFRTLSEGTSWLALHDLAPDHVLYVLGRGFPIAELRLERLTDLRSYVVLPWAAKP